MTRLTRGLLFASVALMALILWVTLTSTLRAAPAAVSVEPAVNRQADFDRICAAVNRGDLGDDQYRTSLLGEAAQYSFVTYEIALSSFCPLPAQWVIVNLTPAAGDVAIEREAPQSVPALGGRTVRATLLTENAAASGERRVWAEYYVCGRFLTSRAS